MAISRRRFMLAGLGLLASGCTATSRDRRWQSYLDNADRPHAVWPQITPPTQPPLLQPTPVRPTPVTNPQPPANAFARLGVIPRNRWSTKGLAHSDIDAMVRVERITVHHEGFSPVWFDDERTTVRRINAVRNAHVGRGWADIGYHYLIDRKGRIWEGRDIRYQGAHVKDYNPHNVGVMLLGNFDKQSPSDPQYAALRSTLVALMATFHVKNNQVFTHQELPDQSTSCPGRTLQSQMLTLRRNGIA